MDRNVRNVCSENWDVCNPVCFPGRCTNLRSIHSQLASCKVRKVAVLLEAVESCYHAAFVTMQQDVLAGKNTKQTSNDRITIMRFASEMQCFCLKG